MAQTRNTGPLGDEWLANTTMEKKLAAKEKAHMTKPDTPFPKHWLYYIVLKYGVIAVAVLITLYTIYRLDSENEASARPMNRHARIVSDAGPTRSRSPLSRS